MRHLALGSNNKNKTVILECQENENVIQQKQMGQCQDSSKQKQFHSKYFPYQNRGSKVNKASTEEVRIKKP